jgi:hypothetical protein
MTTINELFDKIGADNIGVQLLNECMTGAEASKKGTRITFLTQLLSANDIALNTGRVGLVVWVDRDHWQRACKELGIGSQQSSSGG